MDIYECYEHCEALGDGVPCGERHDEPCPYEGCPGAVIAS